MKGLDRYSGSQREIRASTDGPLVRLSVEATSGSQEGEALITPSQARALAKYLQALAEEAEAAGTELEVNSG